MLWLAQDVAWKRGIYAQAATAVLIAVIATTNSCLENKCVGGDLNFGNHTLDCDFPR